MSDGLGDELLSVKRKAGCDGSFAIAYALMTMTAQLKQLNLSVELLTTQLEEIIRKRHSPFS